MTRMMDDRETWYTLIDSLLSMMLYINEHYNHSTTPLLHSYLKISQSGPEDKRIVMFVLLIKVLNDFCATFTPLSLVKIH